MAGQDRALRITGGAQLVGDICVSGSKNAALPELAAAVLTPGPVTLHNVRRVTDTALMPDIFALLGGEAKVKGTVVHDAGGLTRTDVPDELARSMRATDVPLR